jgi:pimeloyl-ACP methyl ester carboxylesterase
MNGVLLIHAFPLDARMWEEQLERFGQPLTVVAPDLPGFGGSPLEGDTMTMGAAADRCLQAIDAAGIEQAVVCGLSMGGYVAFELWRRAPERFAGLVLANTKAAADTPEGAEGRRKLAARLAEEGSWFMVEDPPPLLTPAAPEELWARVASLIAEQPASAIAAAALGMAERPDSTGDLGGITVPTLVITSDADTLIPPDVTAPMAEQIPGAELAVIPRAGHLSNLEAEGAFDDLLATHLRRCRLLA